MWLQGEGAIGIHALPSCVGLGTFVTLPPFSPSVLLPYQAGALTEAWAQTKVAFYIKTAQWEFC